MKLLKVIPLVLVAFTLMACSFTVNVPTVRTGVDQTFEISEAAIDGVDTQRVTIEMGAGRLDVSGGADQLIEGTIRYNVSSWLPAITRSAEEIILSQRNNSNVGFPDGDIVNEWDLRLGDQPIDLTLSTGAYEGNLDLSGMAITNLAISDGASKATVEFNSLNPVEMQRLTYKTGASDVDLLGLGNANVKEIIFESGVGSYTLDFSGDLQQDVNVSASSGMSDLTILIPEGTQARVTISGGLSNVDATGTWTINGSTYTCGDSGPMITIRLDMGLGNLNLRR